MRLRLLLPGGRGGAGLSSLRLLWAAAVALPVLLLSACGSVHPGARETVPLSPIEPAAVASFGLSENNANLLWSPSAQAPAGADAFLSARRALTALHPRYLRLVIDWASLQPRADSPAALDLPTDGCARGVAPCGPYAGISGELEAIASQQHEHPGSFQVVIDIYGVPGWAALPPHGCERDGSDALDRPLRPGALSAYRALIHGLIALGRSKGVALPWWSPWNEPNDPRFLAPQRASCDADGEPLAPAVYAQLARAMNVELTGESGEHHLLLGELGGYESGSAHRTSIGEFVDALPADVLCMSRTWAVHGYAARGLGSSAVENPVEALEAALGSRGGCASTADIWVTESGAGAPEPGRPRRAGVKEEQAGCLALASELLGWYADPRVKAIFQYTFRDDPDFPVGLFSADLQHVFPVYGMWLAISGASSAGGPLPTAGQACGHG